MSDFIIREGTPDDAAAVIALMKIIADEPNNGITRVSAAEFDVTVEQERDIIQQFSDMENALYLVAEADGEIIGNANCRGGKRGHRHNLGLGITIVKEWRGKGVGTALLQTMIEWCEENPTVKRLELMVFHKNPGAIRLYERLGFQHEGVKKSAFFKHDEFLDMLIMAIVFDKEISYSH
jgi:RimJ/RimL family protein N-acetyltransferase